MKNKKMNLSGAFAILLALLILLVFVPVNMIFSYYDKVYDLTPSGKYSLDPVTEQLLDDCSDKQIEVYFLNSLFNLKSDANCLPVYHTLMELDSRDNITLTCFDPDENVELAESLNPTGALTVSRNDIFVKCGDNIRQISGNLFQTDSNGIVEYAGENLIAGAIYICTTGNLPTIYFLKGYSDKTLDGNYSSYRDVVRGANYRVEELDLSSVDTVPRDTAIICLAAPTRDISDSDREKLSNYIDNGGSLQMMLSPCDTTGRFENIEYLLAKFEIGMDYNIIKEQNPDWQLRNLNSEQDPAYFLVTYPTKSDDYSEDLTTDLNQLIANGIYTAGVSNIRSFYEITSASEMIEKASIIENLPTAMDSEEYTCISEPMGGDSTTAESAEAKSNEPLIMGYYSYNKQTGAKLIAVGCDEPIDDTFHIPTVGTRCLIQFSNSWLYNSDVDMGIQNKFNSYDTMTFEDGKDATRAIRLFFIVPAVFAVLGLAVWLKRRYA
ncbi:MAG: GldG family protein [Ruminococcus sp.]|nr:GldG family protein [Ruminococcus sp.]MDE6784736.1 GldG family protein [Ruminococcus sp.]